MSKHLGNLTVTQANAHSFPAVTEIYGHLTIAAGAELRATKLTTVRGWVTVQGHLVAPMLGLVDGWLTLAPDSSFSAIHLNEVRQDFSLAGGCLLDAPALRLIGSLNVGRDGIKNLIGLEEVRENVTLLAGANVQAQALTRIGKSLTLREGATLDAPLLNHIGGYADIDETARIVAPKFVS